MLDEVNDRLRTFGRLAVVSPAQQTKAVRI
jgi:hypothetical protein